MVTIGHSPNMALQPTVLPPLRCCRPAAKLRRYALAGFQSMTLKRFRNIIQWPTLALAVVLFAGDWFTRVHYVAFIDNAYIDSTPRIVNQIWLLLLFVTFVFGIVTIPRVPSFLALLSVLWVLFLSIQGH